MKKLMIFLVLLGGVTACKTKTTVVIQAEHLSTGSGAAYSGMEYSVVETWTPFSDIKTNTVANGFLDENGAASFELKMKENRKYYLGIETPENICYTEVTIQEPLVFGENNNVNFFFTSCGFLDIKSNNINCQDSSDEFRFRYYYQDNPEIYTYKGFGNISEWNYQVGIYGCQDYSNTFTYTSVPGGDYVLEWEVIRQSGTITGTDIFTVNEGDTTTFIIEY